MEQEVKKIGRYDVIRELGRGGMGVVYLASDPNIGREIAVKILDLRGFTEDQAREIKERFQREARAAGILNDPNIVTIYEFGEHEGEWFIAMEYVPGRSLEDLLEGDALLSLPRVLEIIEGVAGALDHAHSKGIVHRDIKPANILLPDCGGVRVTDFGIARIENLRITREGAMLGSPSYMSPEQILGREIDSRSDVFSLGVILYILLTGEKPFPGESLATLSYRIVQEAATPPSQLTPGLNPTFDALMAKVLAKDPNARYQRAGQVAADLRLLVEASVNENGSTLVVQTIGGGTKVSTGIRQTSFPSITGIPVPEGQTVAMQPELQKRPSRSFVISGAIILVALVLGIYLFINSFREGGSGGLGGTTPAVANPGPNYRPLGIVPRPFVLWREAKKAISQEDPKAAILLLKELEMLTPADSEVHLAIGKAEYSQGKKVEAMEAYRRALQLDSKFRKDPELISALVESIESPRTAKEAMGILTEFIGEAAEKSLLEAAASQNSYQGRNALTALTNIWVKRIANNPNDVETRLSLARAYFRLSQHQDAIKTYLQVLKIQPEEKKNPELILNLVEMLDGPEAADAMELLGKQIGSVAVTTLKQVGPDRSRRMKENVALTLNLILEEQVRQDSSNSQAALDLAILYAGKGDYPRAWEFLSIAIKRDPSIGKQPNVLDLLMNALKQEEPGEAINILAKQIGEPVLPQIKQALVSSDHNMRWNAAAVLQAMGRAGEVDRITLLSHDLLDSNSSCPVRRDALKQLDNIRDKRADAEIDKAFQDPRIKKCVKKQFTLRGAPKPEPTPAPPPAPTPQPKKKRKLKDIFRGH